MVNVEDKFIRQGSLDHLASRAHLKNKQTNTKNKTLKDSPMQNCTSKEKKLGLFLQKGAVNHQMQGFLGLAERNHTSSS